MHSWSSIALPALLSSSGLIPVLPWFPTRLQEPGSKFKQNVPLVELWAKSCCFSLFLPPLHPLPGGLHLKLSPPYFLFDILVPCFFLTAVQPLLSDGLFCCLKHLIGGQVYIIRGEFSVSSTPWSATLSTFSCPLHAILMGGRKKVIDQHDSKIVRSIKSLSLFKMYILVFM